MNYNLLRVDWLRIVNGRSVAHSSLCYATAVYQQLQKQQLQQQQKQQQQLHQTMNATARKWQQTACKKEHSKRNKIIHFSHKWFGLSGSD